MGVLPWPIQLALAGAAALVTLGALATVYERFRRRGVRRCIYCGCTDFRACAGGCSWVSVDPPTCSSCVGW